MRTFLRNYTLSLFTILMVFYLSFLTPPRDMEIPDIPYMDKIAHFCMYAGLTTILWIEYLWHHKDIQWSHLIIGGIICPIVMSGLIEIGQSTLTTNRCGEWWDFAANSFGVLVGALFVYYVWQPMIENLKNRFF